MANTKSAIKRIRRISRQTVVNKSRKSKFKNAIKKMNLFLDSKKKKEALRESARLTLGDLIRKYRDEITPNKKGEREEAYKLNLLLRHKIAKCRLLDLKAKNIFDFKIVGSRIHL